MFFLSVWPKKTGSVSDKCLIRTIFSLLNGRSSETENRGKRGSDNMRTRELKEPNSRRHENVNGKERHKNKEQKERIELV